MPNALVKNLRRYPHLHDEDYAKERFGAAAAMGPLVLPDVAGEQRRVVYSITEYDPILDSSNMTIQDWIRIAEDIKVLNLFCIKTYLKIILITFSFNKITAIV